MDVHRTFRAVEAQKQPCFRSHAVHRHTSVRQFTCSPPGAGGSFFSSLTKILNGDKVQKEERKGEATRQGSTSDKLLTPSSTSKPVFPPYTVVRKAGEYVLRLYDVFSVVEMEYQRREEGYASLGNYIDGGNAAGARFAYSQPVVMCYSPCGRKVMQVHVGPRVDSGEGSHKTSSITSLPAPNEPAVRLNVSGGELVAVLQFEGYITPSSAESARQKLVACLKRDGIQLSDKDANGHFRCAQYGAVYQLGERLNELMLQVAV